MMEKDTEDRVEYLKDSICDLGDDPSWADIMDDILKVNYCGGDRDVTYALALEFDKRLAAAIATIKKDLSVYVPTGAEVEAAREIRTKK